MAKSTPFQLILLLLAITTAAAVATFAFSINPCTYTLSRTLLSISGLDRYLISCVDTSTNRLEDGGSNKGKPITTDMSMCGPPELPPNALPPFYCCPPATTAEPVNFTFPNASEPLRTRRPVHGVGDEYMAKYRHAVALLKALPKSDPRSFYQQANVHCAYCAGAYRQVGHPELAIQIHMSWLFFPFHRAFLYFFERIVARILDEPAFTVSFWSWDVPDGMQIPAAFADPSSPLYDAIRNPNHARPKLVDLDFMFAEKNYTDEEQIQHNLRVMYKQMISNAPLPSLFHGQPYRTGDKAKPGPGTVEESPHNTMHAWTGDLAGRPNIEDMGVYYSAARDPIFFPHHSNIDRLWDAWRRISHRHVDYTDPDWLDASFLFYDEDARLVRIRVRDVLDLDKLRYTYDGAGLPWLDARPSVTPNVNNKSGTLKSVRFPVLLESAVTTEVRRPRVSRSRRDKNMEEEVLVVEGIEIEGTEFVRFDVYINAAEYEKVGPGGREMARSFVSLIQNGMDGMKTERIETSMRVALNELLEDLDAEGDESLTVTLVPRKGKVRIGGLRIEYLNE